ncbi:putative ribonuclease H-like domain-containing protein [Tanacetum coccineum]|uniref:Ribonuclease H-like domain-containing protein n=1 Tax=Tanacetum coccineum TaxID=301880 RepID=A0ABQ5H656_9ASTR
MVVLLEPIYPRWTNVKDQEPHITNHEDYTQKLAFRPQKLKTRYKKTLLGNIIYYWWDKRAVVKTSKGREWKISLKFKGNLEIFTDHVVVVYSCSNHMPFNKAYLFQIKKRITMEALWLLEVIPKEKNSVLFTDTECLILSPSFKLLDKSQVVLRAPRQNDVYSLDLNNIAPSGGKPPSISFMRPFGCPLTILNTLDPLGKFDGKSDEGYLLGYSTTSKAFRVYNKRTKRVEENMHIDFLEDQPNVAGSGPDWMFDLDFLTNTMNYIPVSVENQVNVDAGTQEHYVAGSSEKDKEPTQEYILLPLHPHRPRILVEDVVQAAQEKPSKNSPKDNDVQDSEDVAEKEEQHMLTKAEQVLKDDLERMIAQEIATKAIDDATRQAFKEEKKRAAQATSINKLNTGRPSVSTSNSPLVSTANTTYASATSTPTGANTEDDSNVFPNDGIFSGAYDDDDVGAKADFNNMDNTIDVSPILTLRVHKDHPKEEPKTISQALEDESWVEAMQEELLQFKLQKVWILVDLPFGKKAIGTKWKEGIDYDEVFAPVVRIEAIRLFLAFASFMGFLVYQMDVKSTFLYGTVEEEVYVHQPPGFVDPAHPNKVYKVIKALYGEASQQIPLLTSMNLRMDGSCAGSFSHIWSMANLRYSDNHNMVAFLKKPTESVGFTEIVDYLKDNKEYTITEASIRSQLQLADATGIINLSDAEIYEGLATLGGYAGEHVPLLPAMLAGAAEDQGEGSAIPAEPHHTPIDPIPSTSQPSIPSTTEPPHSSPPRSIDRQNTEVPQPQGPTITFVADEATTTSVGVETEGAATTTSGLDAGMDSGNIHESPLRSHEAPLPEGNTSGSAEDSLQLKELMAIVPKMVTKIDSLEKELKETKQTLGHVVLTLVKKVKSLEVALKRMSKRVILSDSEDEETENQGRKIQDIDD